MILHFALQVTTYLEAFSEETGDSFEQSRHLKNACSTTLLTHSDLMTLAMSQTMLNDDKRQQALQRLSELKEEVDRSKKEQAEYRIETAPQLTALRARIKALEANSKGRQASIDNLETQTRKFGHKIELVSLGRYREALAVEISPFMGANGSE